MFDLREFIKKGLIKGVGQMRDAQLILNAAGWYEKGVLTDEDMASLNEAIENQYASKEELDE